MASNTAKAAAAIVLPGNSPVQRVTGTGVTLESPAPAVPAEVANKFAAGLIHGAAGNPSTLNQAPLPPNVRPSRRPKAGDLIVLVHAHRKDGVQARIDRVIDPEKGIIDLTVFDEISSGLHITSSPYDPAGLASDSWKFADAE